MLKNPVPKSSPSSSHTLDQALFPFTFSKIIIPLGKFEGSLAFESRGGSSTAASIFEEKLIRLIARFKQLLFATWKLDFYSVFAANQLESSSTEKLVLFL